MNKDKLEKILNSIRNLHRNIANDVWGTNKLTMWCKICGRSEIVDPAYCLAHGWPKCCEKTMSEKVEQIERRKR